MRGGRNSIGACARCARSATLTGSRASQRGWGAYVSDTAFRVADATHREVTTPATLCKLPLLEARTLRDVQPLGKVAVIVPRNSVGLTIAKAVVRAYLSGNEVLRAHARAARADYTLKPLAAWWISRWWTLRSSG